MFASDHLERCPRFHVKTPTIPRITRTSGFNYRAADFNQLRTALRCLPWFLLNDLDVDSATELFYDLLNAAIADYVPTVSRSRRLPPWFDRDVQCALRDKNLAHRLKKSQPTPEHDLAFSRARAEFKRAADSKYREYLLSLVKDFPDNPKRLWSFVKSLKSSSQRTASLVHNGLSYSKATDCANIFNATFGSKFSDPHVGDLPKATAFPSPPLTKFTVPPGKIHTLLLSIGRHKACGPDGLSARIIHECAAELVTPLEILCSLSVHQGVFPKIWKEANIIPIHKKGDKKNPSNYRGISLLPLCSKVLEKVVCDTLLAHVLPSLPPCQHGFLPNRSCASNLSVFLKHSWDSIQAGAQTDSIYTDYSSAFTSVNHILLIHKLKTSFNVTGPALSWIQSYLTDRRQRVVLDGCCSDWIPVRSGVPEGSVCGPLLFICFTADLPSVIQTNCIMYADDIKLYHRITSHSDTEALQSDLNRLATWSATWHLKLNPAKCHTITFSLRKLPIPATYTLDGTALQRRTETRDLGVILDSKLTFAAHIDTTIAKANRMLGLLIRSMQASRRHSRAPIDHKVMLCTFYAHVRSILEFGCVVWAGAAVSHLKRLERVQHKFLMWLASCSDKRSDNLDYLVLLSHFKVRSIKSRFVQHDLMFLFHVHHARLDSTVLLGAFGLNVPGRSTRSSVLWHVPRARVNTVQRSLYTRIPSTCNSLLQSDSSVDFFTSSSYSYKSSAIKFSNTRGSFM